MISSPRVFYAQGWKKYFYFRSGDFMIEMFAWYIWATEFASWFMFYWSKDDAIKYAKYIIASNTT